MNSHKTILALKLSLLKKVFYELYVTMYFKNIKAVSSQFHLNLLNLVRFLPNYSNFHYQIFIALPIHSHYLVSYPRFPLVQLVILAKLPTLKLVRVFRLQDNL